MWAELLSLETWGPLLLQRGKDLLVILLGRLKLIAHFLVTLSWLTQNLLDEHEYLLKDKIFEVEYDVTS